MVPDPPAAGGRGPETPWRELGLVASLIVLGWPVALLAVVFPFTAFLAAVDPRPRRAAAAALAAALTLWLALEVPAARPFALAAALAVTASLIALRRAPRVGYAELSLTVFTGLAAAGLVWGVARPGFFGALQVELRQATDSQGRVWLEWLDRAGWLDPQARLILEDAAATSAELASRTWPAGVFVVLWLGCGAALALAAGRARGSAAAERVRVTEPAALFRVPDAWIWIFLASVAVYLLAEDGSWAQDAALNAALVAAGVYVCQGLAVGVYYLERRGTRPLLRFLWLGVGLLLLPRPLLVLALCVGLADARFDLRARHRGKPPAARPG